MINKFIHICNKVLTTTLCLVTLISLVLSFFGSASTSLYGSIIVKAQDTEVVNGTNVFGSIGFSECRVKPAGDGNSFDQTLESCIIQIVQFFFIVALFIIAIRIGLEALSGLNPFDKSKAIDNTSKLVKDLIIGLVLLGSPAILLTLFNTTTLDFGSVLSLTSSTSNGGGGGTSGGSGTNGNGNSGGGTNNNLTLEQQGVWIEINDTKYALNHDTSTLSAADKTIFDNASKNLYDFITKNSPLDGAIKLNTNASFNDFINATKSSNVLTTTQKTALDNAITLNSNFKGGSATKNNASQNNIYTIRTKNCPSNTAIANCTKTAILANTNNGCANEFVNNPAGSPNYTISENLPTIKCFFIEK